MDWLSSIREIFGLALPFLERLPFVRAILGFILVFLLPGFAWTLVFFKGKQIGVLERGALSFGLSIALVTLSLFFINRVIGVSINGFNAVLIIMAITIVPVTFYYLNKLIGRH